MSLETNLELNNQLVTRNNELLERLISTLASGVVMRPDAIAQVQEYHETVAKTKAALTLDDLTFSDVIALAAFYPVPQQITEEMLQRAIAYRDATGEARVMQIDALDSALQGVKRAKELLTPALLDLSRNILKFWDDLPTIGERRAFAERLLDAPPAGRDEVKPKKGRSKSEPQKRKGPFFVRDEDGKIGELSTEAELKAHLDAGYTEINKVEYLQRKEEAEKAGTETADDQTDFAVLRKQAEGLILQLAKGGYRAEAIAILEKQGAKKLGEVADENLADVIAQAEKALSVE
ncbi:hypothetical protein ABIJ78_003761 [Salmonella enterica]|uniref:hypothetical protein n=1 Tax=Salmonella enterica TaxID=28901 RepID=UPI0008A9A388|nr:hypothetical protein [Salmonella enterica]EBP3231758.1 hypothetical protein [Salmonella enterica subsp. enterica]EDL6184925.1 hypothetical protein [Salmonella enterica subsp. enterica serovar Bareilly]EDR1790153.1 hypothetical protein [Salmonella enterica subsp. enterica serovar Norwich]EAN2140848.1 hypothetical protein [Salmonella enterica]EAN5532777.1 hypothetical protein [Salmonella enterica]